MAGRCHLCNALLGEMVLEPLKSNTVRDWDQAFELWALECFRLARVYALHFASLLLSAAQTANDALERAANRPPPELLN